jgi:hypothetical protein
VSKRSELDLLAIDASYLHKLMRSLFSKANDYGPFSGEELIEELRRFGVRSRKQTRLLLKKHRRALIDIDRSSIDTNQTHIQAQLFGDQFVAMFRRTGVWFAYPALVRLTLELEFGERYRSFADERDAVH